MQFLYSSKEKTDVQRDFALGHKVALRTQVSNHEANFTSSCIQPRSYGLISNYMLTHL